MFATVWRAGGIPLCFFDHPTESFLDGRQQTASDPQSKAENKLLKHFFRRIVGRQRWTTLLFYS